MNQIPEMIAAFSFFGLVFILPLVHMLMKHQRAMSEILHTGPARENQQRLEALEQEVRALRASNHELILQQDDQREVRRRLAESPPLNVPEA